MLGSRPVNDEIVKIDEVVKNELEGDDYIGYKTKCELKKVGLFPSKL